MRIALLLHIAAGGLGLLAGYAALAATKGARFHRRAGFLFVAAMVVMGLTGSLIAAVHRVEASVIAGLVAAYLVVTALTTVRPPSMRLRWIDAAAMAVALVVGLTSVTLGIELLVTGGMRDGMPAFPFFVLGLPALLGGVADIRVLRVGRLTGAPRLTRHLWRMCYALLIAALSFFLGQADEFPAALRVPVLLALPVLVVLVAMLYWLWRIRVRRSLRGVTSLRMPEVAS